MERERNTGESHTEERHTGQWSPEEAGLLRLPSGRLIRGRALHRPLDPTATVPSYGVYLLGRPPVDVPWPHHWLHWPDFRLPTDREATRTVLAEAWERAATERVEIGCGGGRGRTGTAMACLAVLDGVPAEDAVAFVRRHYHRHAVETPWQRRYVRRFA
ncbi:protein-tyrosine phosphatase family protein [Streptomyces sp. NPDC002888]|uniref:phosphatase domain-containing protein n=1 Tax=Streptomyces sp. NPDC002888 TaxID=3364668 RepID=UPI0036B35484